jgi:hypothetical protein
MTHVVLQPTASADGRAHYRQTIENLVPRSTWSKHVSNEVAEALNLRFPDGNIPFWGVTPGTKLANSKKWSSMDAGDIVLFAKNGSYFSRAVVAYTFQSAELARSLWGVDGKGKTWEFMYAVDEVINIDVPYKELNPVLGYKDDYVPQGFNVLGDAKSEVAIDYLGLRSTRWEASPSGEALTWITAPEGNLDRKGAAKSRAEQALLRNVIIPGRDGKCALCGRVFPREYLRAAHIKPRARCTDEERRDLEHIAMPACVFGCDVLYENGLITLSQSGEVLISDRVAELGNVKTYTDTFLIGRRTHMVMERRAKYAAWHSEERFK